MRRGLGLVVALVVASTVMVGPATARDSKTSISPKGMPGCRFAAAFSADLKMAGPVGLAQSCPGLRPGAVVRIPSRSTQCTLNALFVGSDGDRYIGTAGHCVVGQDKETAWARGKGPVAHDGNGKRFGEFAYAVLKDAKDMAVIRIDKGVASNPQMCHFGGPTGMAGNASGPTLLEQFGNGLALGDVAPGRTQLALSLADPDRLESIGLATPGDSGSLVTTAAGGAVGVLVTTGFAVGVNDSGSPVLGNVGITRFVPQLTRATQVTGVKYTLQTAPLL